MRRQVRFAALVGCVVCLSASLPRAQQVNGSLATLERLSCTFRLVATGTWTGAEARAAIKPATLSIQFDAINADEGTARSVGGFGPSDILVKLSPGALHFVQVLRAGPIYVTTVFDRDTSPGKRRAVHSRHEDTLVSLPGFTSSPEQYYGECEVPR